MKWNILLGYLKRIRVIAFLSKGKKKSLLLEFSVYGFSFLPAVMYLICNIIQDNKSTGKPQNILQSEGHLSILNSHFLQLYCKKMCYAANIPPWQGARNEPFVSSVVAREEDILRGLFLPICRLDYTNGIHLYIVVVKLFQNIFFCFSMHLAPIQSVLKLSQLQKSKLSKGRNRIRKNTENYYYIIASTPMYGFIKEKLDKLQITYTDCGTPSLGVFKSSLDWAWQTHLYPPPNQP